ncbi:hypothetical protein [Bradyrhizobium sp. NBAIM02]|uniref:hypothetical protein n=1 Tax=Bradyrhizobium sp. NBAIM02 TaxID=2793817 RepID=UPI001CD2BEE7|nr:hypothetical protein [Bradyrhizobium sp. NBAIM02]MCA1503809.1 hypothetical protein [Bradyrhizobium sp. NBAIM02]
MSKVHERASRAQDRGPRSAWSRSAPHRCRRENRKNWPSQIEALFRVRKQDEVAARRVIAQVMGNPLAFDRISLGRALKLTPAEREAAKAWDIWPEGWSHAEWKAWKASRNRQRAARNYARQKKARAPRPITLTARAMILLSQALAAAGGSLRAAEIMRQAVLMRLQPKGSNVASPALRDAAKELGIVRRKDGWGGWIWSLPATVKREDDECVFAPSQSTRQLIDIAKEDEGSSPTVYAAGTVDHFTRNGCPRTDLQVAAEGQISLREAPSPTTNTTLADRKEPDTAREDRAQAEPEWQADRGEPDQPRHGGDADFADDDDDDWTSAWPPREDRNCVKRGTYGCIRLRGAHSRDLWCDEEGIPF